MPKTTTMTVRSTPELSDRLEALARDTNRRKSYVAGEAIAPYVEMHAWQVARIKAAFAEARSGPAACRTKRSSAGSNPGAPQMSAGERTKAAEIEIADDPALSLESRALLG